MVHKLGQKIRKSINSQPRPNYWCENQKLYPNCSRLERQKLSELTETIWQHLTPVEQSLESKEDLESLEDIEISYRPMPPKRSFTVRVRYQDKGRGEPLPYSLELDEE